ncbi:MAG: sporulation protein YunB [Firmicutes bacterium]|nr:sporulation protein YunB [Bacillota bacterium]
MFRRRNALSREARVFLLLALLLFIVIQMFMMLERSLRPTIWAVARVKSHQLATSAMNQAILDNVAHRVSYQDIIHLVTDQNGKIVLAQVNQMEINSIIAETTLYVQQSLKDLSQEKISIPLGQVLGSYLLSNFGPKLPITITPLGVINTTLVDKFENAGINQVRHKIYLEVQTEMQVVVPLVAEKIRVSSTIPIVDAIYPGEVPDTVINLEFPNSANFPVPVPPNTQ